MQYLAVKSIFGDVVNAGPNYFTIILQSSVGALEADSEVSMASRRDASNSVYASSCGHDGSCSSSSASNSGFRLTRHPI